MKIYYIIVFLVALSSEAVVNALNIGRAPRPSETDGIENQLFGPEAGEAACCPIPRDLNVTGDLYVGGTITGTIIIPSLAAGALVINNSGIISSANGTAGYVLTSNGVGALPTFQSPAFVNAFIQGGNAFGATAVLGTIDANPLTFITGSGGPNTRMTISTNGNVTINPPVSGVGLTVSGGGVSVSSGNVSLVAGNLNLPNSTATTGNVIKGGVLFIHNFGIGNTFLGASAGNLTNTGIANIAFGANTLSSLTSGTSNVALGNNSLNLLQNGVNNIGVGVLTLANATSAQGNIAIGFQSLTAITTGNANVAIGDNSGNAIATGEGNVYLGTAAGIDNTLADSYNIYIGYFQRGVVGESNTTRIGATPPGSTTACYISGIYGATYGGTSAAVFIDNTGKLGTTPSSRRYKDNIKDLLATTERFMSLRPVQFNYKNQSAENIQYGLIAEEVETVYPELVNYGEEGQVESVKYHLLYALLIKMIQEQRKEMQALKDRVLTLESQNVAYEALLNRLS